ncbi:competence protein ComK [Mesobacillus persicus]|uniref:Competence protein ComK n=1 Tax=Mesobacillus persicus TaxID=930146 RepID=A0A1H8AVL0_9BACI|nr:competence protein ComK [Mesobacillus persicus]SEM74516.1 competence protein ComK [Mesobacillus persicus]
MLIKRHYLINQQFMSMAGFYDRHGKLCTLVRETERTFIVDKSPIEILDESICWVGYDLKGAILASKRLLGDIQMCPIMVNPVERIVLFPTQSHKNAETTWLNPAHIRRTISMNRQTLVRFTNGTTLLIPSRLSSFNTKIQNAEQLEDITARGPNSTFSFILDPKKRKKKKKQRQ